MTFQRRIASPSPTENAVSREAGVNFTTEVGDTHRGKYKTAETLTELDE
mgnify:FL=1